MLIVRVTIVRIGTYSGVQVDFELHSIELFLFGVYRNEHIFTQIYSTFKVPQFTSLNTCSCIMFFRPPVLGMLSKRLVLKRHNFVRICVVTMSMKCSNKTKIFLQCCIRKVRATRKVGIVIFSCLPHTLGYCLIGAFKTLRGC